MSENRHEHRTPRKRDIEQARTACLCPPDVVISRLPKTANVATGTGIRDGALVLSPSHLKYIRFPLHPLFHVVLSALDLHPMQLSPNSYLQLSAFLALCLQMGTTIDCADFFHLHDCCLIRDEVEYFHFASKSNGRTFVEKPSSHKNWKDRPLLITGKWAAPELKVLKIRSTFARAATNFTTSPSRERIQWLNTHLTGSCLDIKEYSTPAILLRISQERTSFIYRFFHPHLHLEPAGLEGKELATHIVESLAKMEAEFSDCPEHVAERERMRKKVEKRNRSGETDKEAVHSYEDPGRVDLDQVRPTTVRDLPDMTNYFPSKPSKLKTKRSGSSALGVKKRLKKASDQSAHSLGTCLEPISSPTYPPLKSIPLNKEKKAALVPNPSTDVVSGHSLNCWLPKFKKDDDTFVTEEEKLVGNPEACLAVWRGLYHPADASVFQKAAPQDIMKAMNSRFIEFGQMAMAIETMLTETAQNNENKEKQLGELKLKFEQVSQRVSELENQLHNVEAERDRLQADIIKAQSDTFKVQSELAETEKKLKNEKHDRELEFQKAGKRIEIDSARHFRLGWVQASLPPDKRLFAGPDEFDTRLRLEPRGYMFFLGMNPSDVEDASENKDDEENENEPEDEDDLDGKEDHDDQDDEDFNDPGRPPQNNQDVSNSLGRSDGYNIGLPMLPQYGIQAETSPKRTYLPPQSNQETSNTTPQQKQTYQLCHQSQINHLVDNNLGLPMLPKYRIQVETSPNRTYLPPQSNQETSNTTPQRKQTTQLCYPAQINHPVDNNLGLSMLPQFRIQAETAPNRTYLPPQSNQEISNTTPQRKQTTQLCHLAQINQPVDNNVGLPMLPQYRIQAETSPNRTYLPPQSNQEISNTTPQQKSTTQLCYPAQINHLVDNNQDVENSLDRRDDNILDFSVHPQNSYWFQVPCQFQVENLPNRTHLPFQLNQETSNTITQLTSPGPLIDLINTNDMDVKGKKFPFPLIM